MAPSYAHCGVTISVQLPHPLNSALPHKMCWGQKRHRIIAFVVMATDDHDVLLSPFWWSTDGARVEKIKWRRKLSSSGRTLPSCFISCSRLVQNTYSISGKAETQSFPLLFQPTHNRQLNLIPISGMSLWMVNV